MVGSLLRLIGRLLLLLLIGSLLRLVGSLLRLVGRLMGLGGSRVVVKLGVRVCCCGLRGCRVHSEAIMSWRRARRGRRIVILVRLALVGHDDDDTMLLGSLGIGGIEETKGRGS